MAKKKDSYSIAAPFGEGGSTPLIIQDAMAQISRGLSSAMNYFSKEERARRTVQRMAKKMVKSYSANPPTELANIESKRENPDMALVAALNELQPALTTPHIPTAPTKITDEQKARQKDIMAEPLEHKEALEAQFGPGAAERMAKAQEIKMQEQTDENPIDGWSASAFMEYSKKKNDTWRKAHTAPAAEVEQEELVELSVKLNIDENNCKTIGWNGDDEAERERHRHLATRQLKENIQQQRGLEPTEHEMSHTQLARELLNNGIDKDQLTHAEVLAARDIIDDTIIADIKKFKTGKPLQKNSRERIEMYQNLANEHAKILDKQAPELNLEASMSYVEQRVYGDKDTEGLRYQYNHELGTRIPEAERGIEHTPREQEPDLEPDLDLER